MTYNFLSLDQVLDKCELNIINFLYDYDLLKTFSPDVKKVIMYFLIKEMNDIFENRNSLIYYTSDISDSRELLEYFPKDKLLIFLKKLSRKIRRITKRMFFIKSGNIPNGNIDSLDGEVVDEIILLNNQEPDLKELKRFLHDQRLGDMFKSIH